MILYINNIDNKIEYYYYFYIFMSKNIEDKKYEIDLKLKDDENNFFIHYQTTHELKTFMDKYKNIFTFGHKCCSGKGCLIKTENNQELKSYADIKRIKMDYII